MTNKRYKFYFFILIILYLIYTNLKIIKYNIEENSLCRSMLGKTYYKNEKELCELPCNILPTRYIPNITYGSCDNYTDVFILKNNNTIMFDKSGYITFINYNNRNSFVKKILEVKVYML